VARPVDLSSLTRPERVVLVSAAALVVDGILPLWFRIVTPRGTFTHNAGFAAWSIVAVAAGAATAIAVLARAAIWPEPAPERDGVAYTTLGLLAAAAVLLQLAEGKHAWIGVWIALACAIGIIGGGLRRRAQRKAGWQ
jgi:hypothetical protein